jgi:hypothetical protein
MFELTAHLARVKMEEESKNWRFYTFCPAQTEGTLLENSIF